MKNIQCLIPEVPKNVCLYVKGQTEKNNPVCIPCLYYQKLQELGFDPINGFPMKELMGFVRYPPDGVIPVDRLKNIQAYATEEEIDINTFLLLKISEDNFKKTKSPFEALRTLILSHEAELYPPIWTIKWFVEALKKYHGSNGTENLEKLLGFRKGRGQESIYKKICEDERDEALMFDVHRLCKTGKTAKEASKIIEKRLRKSKGWNKTGLKLRPIKAGTLEKIYSQKWKQIFEEMPFT